MACKAKRKAACLEEQLFLLGLIVPFIAVPIYYLYVEYLLPLSPFKSCLWDKVLGIYCPGCGGTRAVEALLHGKFFTSAWYHPAVMYGVCIYCVFMFSHFLNKITKGRIKGIKFHSWYLYGAVVIIVANCLIRNYLRLRHGIYL